MPLWTWFLIAAMLVVAAVVLGAALALGRRRRSTRLKERFGPEYERTVSAAGNQRAAEKELTERERTHNKLDIRALTPTERDGYAGRWQSVQTAFIDDPPGALGDADRLVIEVMRARGYPVDDFDRRAADISVDHPTVVENYRAAHAIHRSQESTETSAPRRIGRRSSTTAPCSKSCSKPKQTKTHHHITPERRCLTPAPHRRQKHDHHRSPTPPDFAE